MAVTTEGAVDQSGVGVSMSPAERLSPAGNGSRQESFYSSVFEETPGHTIALSEDAQVSSLLSAAGLGSPLMCVLILIE